MQGATYTRVYMVYVIQSLISVVVTVVFILVCVFKE